MGMSRRPYAPEFRREMVELVRAGRESEKLAKEFELMAPELRSDGTSHRRQDGWRLLRLGDLAREPRRGGGM